MSTEIAKIEKMESFIDINKQEIAAVASKYLSAERIVRVGLSTIRMNPKLQACDPYSILNCLVESAKMGLEPTGKRGGAYMVPFKTEAVLIPDYRGLIRLAKKSGLIVDAQAHAVYENDEFSLALGDSPKVTHNPALNEERGKFRGAYAIAWLPNTNIPHAEWMNKDEIDRIKSRSKAKDYGPWVTDYEAMGIKSALKRLFNRMDTEISPELEFAMFKDNEVLGYANSIEAEEIEPIRMPEPIPAQKEPKNKEEKITKIREWILTLSGGDQSKAKEMLADYTSFEGKDGNLVPGVETTAALKNFSDKRLNTTYGKIKKEFFEIFPEVNGTAEPPSETNKENLI